MFVDLKDKNVLIAGGGNVAFRKAYLLKDFGARITMIAPEFIALEDKDNRDIRCITKEFCDDDVKGFDMLIAATGDRCLNARIAGAGKDNGIPVNAVDDEKNCSFIFPSVIRDGDVVIAVSSGGNSPVLTQHVRDDIRKILPGDIGQIAGYMGSVRRYVTDRIEDPKARRACFEMIYGRLTANADRPDADELDSIIESAIGDIS